MVVSELRHPVFATVFGIFTLWTIVLTAACGHAPTAPSPAAGSAERDGLRLSAVVSDSSLGPGESAFLTIRLENLTSNAVTLQFSDSCQVLPFIERSGQGVLFPEGGGWVCAQVITDLTVPPKGSITREVQVNGVRDATTDRMFVTLPPGDYRAYGRLKHSTRGFRSAEVRFTVE